MVLNLTNEEAPVLLSAVQASIHNYESAHSTYGGDTSPHTSQLDILRRIAQQLIPSKIDYQDTVMAIQEIINQPFTDTDAVLDDIRTLTEMALDDSRS